MIILKEIFGPLIRIAFNKSWHSIAHCQRWPRGKSLLVRFLLNWKWQGTLGALLLLFVTNENFAAEFSCWRVSICVFSQPEEGEENPLKHNSLCHGFSIVSRSFWVMRRSSVVEARLYWQRWLLESEGWGTGVSCCPVTQQTWVFRYVAEILMYSTSVQMRGTIR